MASAPLPRSRAGRRPGRAWGAGPASRALAGIAVAALLSWLAGCADDAPEDGGPGPGPAGVIHLQPDFALGDAPGSDRPAAASPGALQTALTSLEPEVRLMLASGRYVLAPSLYEDPSCGNCEDASERVPATLGARIAGSRIVIEGASADSVVIETHAGYGLLFEDCEACVLRGVTVTGGTRDEDGRATSGAIVVRDASVRLEDCGVRDNVGDSAVVAGVVVGIAGIVGREGAELTVERCRIERNSWDGIVLYRDARATIRDNVVDGVDAARGAHVGGGRGVGIGLTWNARAVIEGNLVRHYWKGIGAFVDARAEIRHNVVEDILTWGIAYWAAGEGNPVAFIEKNAVYRTGACGVMLVGRPAADGAGEEGEDGAAPGSFRANAIVQTAGDPRYDSGEPYCTQVPVAVTELPMGFVVDGTILFGNRHPGSEGPVAQLDRAEFEEAIGPLLDGLGGFAAPAESAFVREWGRR